MNMKKQLRRILIILLILTLALQTAACGTRNDQDSDEGVKENLLKPGDEGFSFNFEMPEDWEPVMYSNGTATEIVSYLIEADSGKGLMPAGEYYKAAESSCMYAELPDESFWNRKEGIPSQLYDLPVNIGVFENGTRLVGGAEFAQLNEERITYYVQAAARAMLIYDNIASFDDASIEKFYDDALYYQHPVVGLEKTYAYGKIQFATTDGMISSEAALVTDESLCYLASDGTIRVRCMLVFHDEYSKYGTEYGRCYTELIIGVIPDSVKTQPCDWQFGDLYFMGYLDILQPEMITSEEYEALLVQYDLKPGIPEMPEWGGVYGGAE